MYDLGKQENKTGKSQNTRSTILKLFVYVKLSKNEAWHSKVLFTLWSYKYSEKAFHDKNGRSRF